MGLEKCKWHISIIRIYRIFSLLQCSAYSLTPTPHPYEHWLFYCWNYSFLIARFSFVLLLSLELRFRENFVSILAILYTSCLALRKLFNPSEHVFSTVTQTHNIYLSVINNCVHSAYGNSEELCMHVCLCTHVLNVLSVHVCTYIHVIYACGSYMHTLYVQVCIWVHACVLCIHVVYVHTHVCVCIYFALGLLPPHIPPHISVNRKCYANRLLKGDKGH